MKLLAASMLSSAFAQDPAGGWMAYAVGAIPSQYERITKLEMTWTVGENPQRSSAFFSPWFGMDPADNLNLVQPVNPWGGSSWSMYTEYYQWRPSHNSNSRQYPVKAGQTLHGTVEYEASSDSYLLTQEVVETGAKSSQTVKCQSGKKYVIPYVVYEKEWRCSDYPPDDEVTFRNIVVECDGSDCTQQVAWQAKVKDSNCNMQAHIEKGAKATSENEISITWNSRMESRFDNYTTRELIQHNSGGWGAKYASEALKRLELEETATIPTHKLNNGVDFPMMSIGTWQYNTATAEQVVKDALSVGFNHIDTANNYNNQKGVGAALKGVPRDSYFLTTKIPDGTASQTRSYLQQDLDELGLEYVDLMLVHYPPRSNSCSAMQAQWAEMENFYKAGKAKAIGVSNYCPSSIECIMQTATVTPAVNQVQYHVGMGVDPIHVKSVSEKYGIHLQAYSPLGDGSASLITGGLVTSIGSNYEKTGAQVSLRWIHENGVSLTTKTTKVSHMQEDLDVFNFQLTDADKATLDAATQPSGRPSFMCNSAEVAV